MSARARLGGIIHTYQKYDPKEFPSPTRPPPDVVSGAMEHMLAYGSLRELSEEELARAVRIDPSQIAGLGPSLDALMEMLRERKRKILATYESDSVQDEAARRYRDFGCKMRLPPGRRTFFQQAFQSEQLHDLERLWYRVEDERGPLASMDVPGSLINAMIRTGPGLPVRLQGEDISVHRTRNTPKCATVVLLDMSGSMRYNGLYINVKRMGLALEGLIRREYPGDYLQFVEIYSFAKPRRSGEIVRHVTQGALSTPCMPRTSPTTLPERFRNTGFPVLKKLAGLP